MGRVFGLVNSAELWVGGRLNEMQTRGGGRRDGSGEGDDGEILEVVQGVVSVAFSFFSALGCSLFCIHPLPCPVCALCGTYANLLSEPDGRLQRGNPQAGG